MRRVAAIVAGALAVLALGSAVVVASPANVAAVPPARGGPAPAGLEQQQVDELTRDGLPPLACGIAPLDMLTAAGGAEKADSAQGRGFRRAIASMADSMSPQTPDNWVILEQSPDDVTYGQRVGKVGISAVFSIERRDGTWTFGGSSGCGHVGWSDHRGADVPGTYTEEPGQVRVTYEGDTCDARPDTLEVFESVPYVDVLLLRPPPGEPVACAGTGVDRSVSAALTRPIGDRTVRDIGVFPAVPLLSAAQAEAQQAADERANLDAQRLCTAAAHHLHLPDPEIAYVSDVASVRAAVPATRETWRHLDDDDLAGDCYLPNGDGSFTVAAAAEGVAPIVRNPHHTAPLRDRIPEVDGRPYR